MTDQVAQMCVELVPCLNGGRYLSHVLAGLSRPSCDAYSKADHPCRTFSVITVAVTPCNGWSERRQALLKLLKRLHSATRFLRDSAHRLDPALTANAS